MVAHLAARDALPLATRRLAPKQAAIAARDVIAAMWDDRDLVNMRIAFAHALVVCARAGRRREAAPIDGWLGSDAVPLPPLHAISFETARHDIEAQLGDDATSLRLRGSAWTPATLFEHTMTTLNLIAESDESHPHPSRVSSAAVGTVPPAV